MAEVEISYKGSNIATMNASGTKTLLTEAKYLEDDVTITYARPSAPSGTKNISITANGVTTEDVTSYASAQITANVPNTYAAADEGKVVSSGALVSQTSRNIDTNGTYDTTTNNEVVVNVSGGGGGGFRPINGAQSPYASGDGAGIYWNPVGGNMSIRAIVPAESGSTNYSWWLNGTRNINNYTPWYLHDIPSGATKLSISADKTCQFHITSGKRESSSSFPVTNSGWINAPVVDYALPSTDEVVSIILRINSSDSAFTASNMPESVTVEFS